MGTGKRGVNTVFAVLGSVAAVGLLTTGVLWAGSNHDSAQSTSKQVAVSPLDKNESQEPRSGSSDSWTPSGRGSVPEKQQSGSPMAKPGEKEMGDPIEKIDPEDMLVSVGPTFRLYVIQPGDTLSSISASVGVSVDRLAQENSIVDVNRIYAGSALVIPVP